MKSSLFYSNLYETLETHIKRFLNNQKNFLSESTVKSTRAVGDAIQDILSENFQDILGKELCTNYFSDFTPRDMEDFAFNDKDDFYYGIDVKTHRLSTEFNMPNLTSVKRLADFYEDDKNYFVVLMIAYDIDGLKAVIDNVAFVPIEFLDWDCLTIGNLGWGQIQIANSNRVTVNPKYSRKKWMIELCDTLLEFYPKEIAKIGKRINRFQKLRNEWGNLPD